MAIISPEDEPWMRLAVGIVEQAVKDYRIALYREKFGEDKTKYSDALEHWFRSEWGQIVCLGQGAYIAHRVKEDVRLGRYY